MRPTLLVFFALSAGAVVAATGAFGCSPTAPSRASTAADFPPITISSTAPTDIVVNGTPNAPQASLAQASAFAWQEFIALNWPALTKQNGQTLRDTPNAACPFGDPNPSAKCAGPLVWQTFRNKAEIFPGTGNPPDGSTPGPSGSITPSYNYDAGPNYVYPSPVSNCPGQTPFPVAPWVNLDETDEIRIVAMYAGIAPTPKPNVTPGAANSQPQIMRYLAKANKTMYTYIQANGLYTQANLQNGLILPSPGLPDPSPGAAASGAGGVSFPNGTFEIKSAWRVLSPTENAARFITTTVRYYENSTNDPQNGTPCYRQDTFGLVALHIIQKTPTAPYFVYASFEQADNILTPDGQPVEDDNGATGANCAGGASPCPVTGLPPSQPLTKLNDVTSLPTNNPPVPPQIVFATPGAPFCNPKKQLFYIEEPLPALPQGGAICVNGRRNPIPDDVVAVNAAAHQAIVAYEAGRYSSPFEHYKLVNVQNVPLDKTVSGPYTGPSPATFSMANIVVETNQTLQLFSGGLVHSDPGTGSNSDFPKLFQQSSPNRTTFANTLYNSGTYNMGGCMGCHGAAGQRNGGDFSVITFEGTVGAPEYPAPLLTAPPSSLSGASRRSGVRLVPVPRNRGYTDRRMAPSH